MGRFQAAAERLGYIVAASNNSRNGPWPPISAAMNAVWTDTHERLAIDPNRIYAAGMSGGNRPAIVLATGHGAGVIACAGAIEPREVERVDGRFAWISVAGAADSNLGLNRKLVADLVGRGLAARMAVFDGTHSWPPEDVAALALEYVHLSAMARRDERRFEAAIEFLGLCARMRPKSPMPVYELARTHAAAGDKRKALEELRKARTLGFAELRRLEVEPEWSALRADPALREIVDAPREPQP